MTMFLRVFHIPVVQQTGTTLIIVRLVSVARPWGRDL